MTLRLDWCSYEAAKYAVMHWHYSKAMPSAKLAKIGVWEDGKFIGAVIFGIGSCNHIGCPYGLTQHEACELVRVALRGHHAPVTRIVAIALKIIRRTHPGLKPVVSYADPSEGHRGGIYQGGNWIYVGQTARDKFPIYKGRVTHPRTLGSLKEGRAKLIDRGKIEYVIKPGKYKYPVCP